MAKLLALASLLHLSSAASISYSYSERERWYEYNSVFIRYGYRMTGKGKLNMGESFNNMLGAQNIEEHMRARGRLFHANLLWQVGGSYTHKVNFMYSRQHPPNETLFEYAKTEIEKHTCIRLVKMEETEEIHCNSLGRVEYFCVYGEEGTCAAEYGQNLTKPALFSITSRCGKRGALREMGHILGLPNAQARADRHHHMSFTYKNIGYTDWNTLRRALLSEHQTCSNMPQEKQKMPYDFTSVMQTGILDFTGNDELVVVPHNPKHLYLIDYANDFVPFYSHYDKWLLNELYNCHKVFGGKCGSKKCKNFGYLTKDCKCICPKGTSGSTCSSKSSTTDIFDIPETPSCYREITSEDDSFTLSDAGLEKALEEPFTQHCVVYVKSPSCRLPFLTVDTRYAIAGLRPKVEWWFRTNAFSCKHFSLYYNVSGPLSRNICWDHLYTYPVYWIFARQSIVWLFVRMSDQEMTTVGGSIKIYVHTTGDYRCKLGSNDIFDAANVGRMRSVGGAAESAKAMAIILPVAAICALIVLGFVYWKFIRPKRQAAAEAKAHGDSTPKKKGLFSRGSKH